MCADVPLSHIKIKNLPGDSYLYPYLPYKHEMRVFFAFQYLPSRAFGVAGDNYTIYKICVLLIIRIY